MKTNALLRFSPDGAPRCSKFLGSEPLLYFAGEIRVPLGGFHQPNFPTRSLRKAHSAPGPRISKAIGTLWRL
jgi:hypothetical protein